MDTQDSPWYLRVPTYLGIVPLAVNVILFLLWCCFRSDVLVIAWIIVFFCGLASVLAGTILLMIATVRRILRRHSPSPISGLRILVTALILVAYIPTCAVAARYYFRLSRQPSVDILEAASRKSFLLQEVTEFLDNDPACVNARDARGDTALHYAATYYREEMAELLISRGADVTIKTTDSGETALHLAADDRTVPIILALIVAGADPNATNNDGNAPIHLAAKWAEVEAVKALLDHGADVNTTNAEGKTPLDLATDQGRRQSQIPASRPERWNECIRMLRARDGVSTDTEQP